MLLYLFGAAAVIVATIFIFKTARENGRSGVIWALVSLVVGFGCQIVVPIAGGIAIAIIYLMTGTPQVKLAREIDGPASILFYVSWLLSFVFLFLVLRFIANHPNEKADSVANSVIVPPPPSFND